MKKLACNNTTEVKNELAEIFSSKICFCDNSRIFCIFYSFRMPRQLKGPVKKESKKEKRAAKKEWAEARRLVFTNMNA